MVRLTDNPDMSVAVYCWCNTLTQQPIVVLHKFSGVMAGVP